MRGHFGSEVLCYLVVGGILRRRGREMVERERKREGGKKRTQYISLGRTKRLIQNCLVQFTIGLFLGTEPGHISFFVVRSLSDQELWNRYNDLFLYKYTRYRILQGLPHKAIKPFRLATSLLPFASYLLG